MKPYKGRKKEVANRYDIRRAGERTSRSLRPTLRSLREPFYHADRVHATTANLLQMHNLPTSIPDDQLPAIAVGVLSYNRREETLKTIEILRSIDYPPAKVHITVIDNASRDGTVEAIGERYQEKVTVMRLRTNGGPVARNRLMLTSPHPYIFIFDDDSAPEHAGTIRGAVEFMEANPYFGVLCFYCYNQSTGMLEFGDPADYAWRRLRNGAYEGVQIVGAGTCCRRDAIQRTEGYDEMLFWGGEEHGLALRLLYHDIPIALHPDYAVIHRHAPRVMASNELLSIIARNDCWVSFKHFPLLLAPLVSAIHTMRWFITALIRRNPEGARGVLEGTWEALSRLGEIFPYREVVPVSKLARYNRWFVATLNIIPISWKRRSQSSQRSAPMQ